MLSRRVVMPKAIRPSTPGLAVVSRSVMWTLSRPPIGPNSTWGVVSALSSAISRSLHSRLGVREGKTHAAAPADPPHRNLRSVPRNRHATSRPDVGSRPKRNETADDYNDRRRAARPKESRRPGAGTTGPHSRSGSPAPHHAGGRAHPADLGGAAPLAGGHPGRVHVLSLIHI